MYMLPVALPVRKSSPFFLLKTRSSACLVVAYLQVTSRNLVVPGTIPSFLMTGTNKNLFHFFFNINDNDENGKDFQIVFFGKKKKRNK